MKNLIRLIKRKSTALLLLTGVLYSNINAQVIVTPGGGSASVISGLGGPGLTISNVTINCDALSYGQFSNGAASGLGVSTGFMLSTGDINQLPGSNSNDDYSYCVGTTFNDPQLTALSSSANQDVCIIEFDVIPQCNNISITFVFGSDEYTNWVNQSFNDAFGFFVSGPNPLGGNYTNVNIATIPGGTPVSIDNVSHLTNTGYFVNNNAGTYNNHFDGFTTVLTPSINVTPCATYHFKLAIADATDCAMDSGVLIDIIQCTSPWTVATSSTPTGCVGNTGTATATVTGGIGPFTYNWSPAPGGGQGTSTATGLATGTYTVTVNDGLTCTPPQVYNVTVGSSGAPPVVTVTPTTATICNGGSVNLTASGATTYTWSPTTGLSATTGANVTASPTTTTTYTVTGTAACGSASASTTITVNQPVTPTFTQVPAICSGGSFTLPTTSNNGFTGTWSPAINNTATTTYTFTPTAGQCATTTTMTVTVNAPTTPTFTQVAPICSGGSFTLPTTSTNSINGTWSPAINNTATTTYTFTPTAGQCATTTTMTVTVNTPTLPTFAAHPPICSGGTITLPTTSTNSINGTWSPAINNTATTTYTFTPTAGQCATTTTMTVNVGAPVTPTFTQVAAICNGGSFTLPTTSDNGFTGTWSPAINNTATTTYTFTPTAGLCATTTTMTVTVNNPITPAFAAIAPICSGGTITLPNTSTNGITGTWSPAINNTATTTYTFTPTAGQCATTTTMTVTVNPIPVATAVSNITACPGDAIPAANYSSTPAGSTFTWTNTNTTIGLGAGGSGNAPAFTAANGTGSSITGTVSITPTLNGCIGNPITYTITVNDLFDATITPAGPFCADATSVNLTAVDAGGVWSGNGITDANLGTFDPATAGAGTHTITYTIAGSCGSTDTENIIVNPIPVVNPITNISVCPGDPIAISNFTSTPGGATFTWINTNTSIGLGANGNGNTPTFTATNSSGSSISGTVEVTPTLNGCIGAPITYTITVSNQLDATITPVGPFCESSSSINLVAVDAGGTWSGNGITDVNLGTFDPMTAGVGTHTITYSIPGSCGDTQTTTIVVDPDLDATITAAGPFCTTDPALSLTAADAGGTWSGTGITNTTLGIFDPSIAGAGVWTVTYTISGMCGDTQTTNITVSDQLDATITPVNPVCEQDPEFALVAVDAGGTWSGTGITNTTTGIFNPSVSGPGTFTITYTLGGNCGDIQTTNITVLPNMDATITAAGPFCTGNTAVNLSAVDAGGTWSGNGITDANLGTFDPATAGVGTHTITYTIPGQCGDVGTLNIVVVSNFSAIITQVGPFCEDESAINLTAVDPGGTWSGTGITNASTGTFDPTVAGPGTHTITYTIPGACGDVQTIDIVVNPLPSVAFSVDNASGCIPLNVTFTDNTIPAGSAAIWTVSNGVISNSVGSFSTTFNTPGCYNVTLQLTSAQGCVSSLTQNNIVCVSGIPDADFSWSPQAATILDPTIHFTNESSGATIYEWDFAGLGNSSSTNPSFVFPSDSPGSYQVCLSASNTAGCEDTVCHIIEIHDEFLVYVPNAFTPDGDGVNDIFMPIITGHDPLSYELMIFNRWGELIFNSQLTQVGWDGNYKAVMSQEDVYVWKIKVKQLSNAELHEYIGHVTLLK